MKHDVVGDPAAAASPRPASCLAVPPITASPYLARRQPHVRTVRAARVPALPHHGVEFSQAAHLAAIERSVCPLPPHAHHAPPHVAPCYYDVAAADDDFFLPAASVDLDSFMAALLGGAATAWLGIPLPPGGSLPRAVASTGLFAEAVRPELPDVAGELSPFIHSAGIRSAAAAVGLDQPPFTPNPSNCLMHATLTMPTPATFSVLEFFGSSGNFLPNM
ncbi:unnamed protein product [Urochloa humidicola]